MTQAFVANLRSVEAQIYEVSEKLEIQNAFVTNAGIGVEDQYAKSSHAAQIDSRRGDGDPGAGGRKFPRV